MHVAYKYHRVCPRRSQTNNNVVTNYLPLQCSWCYCMQNYKFKNFRFWVHMILKTYIFRYLRYHLVNLKVIYNNAKDKPSMILSMHDSVYTFWIGLKQVTWCALFADNSWKIKFNITLSMYNNICFVVISRWELLGKLYIQCTQHPI